jgi:hypothetical protein
MIDEGNWAVDQLGLPSDSKLKLENLIESFVTPPQFGFRGYIGTTNLAFQFDEHGKIKYIFYYPSEDIGRDTSSTKYYEEMSRKPMLVDSNSAGEAATSWLKALQIDVDAMNRVTQPVADRYMYGGRKPSHVWWVTWPEPKKVDKPFLFVVVDGTTKTPQRIKLNQSVYALRPGIAVTNAVELMKIPDAVPQHDPLRPHLNASSKTLSREAARSRTGLSDGL